MITYFLRFPDQSTWKEKAAEVGVRTNNPIFIEEESIDPDTGDVIPAVYEDNWSWHYYTHDWAVDEIGIIYNNDGVYDPDTGDVITPPTPMEGWHVNVKSSEDIDWSGFTVTPETPYRKFAGD